MTTSATLRRTVVATTVGSFSLVALMGVLALLGGGDFGDTQVRVLVTTMIVGLTSVAILCYLATAETPYTRVGAAGGVVVVLPLLTSLTLTWSDDTDNEFIWKTFGAGLVAAATLAQASLLLAVAGRRPSLRPLLIATLVVATGLALIVSGAILTGQGPDGVWRLMGIMAILDVLGTVVTIAIAVFGGVATRAGSGPHVATTRQSGGLGATSRASVPVELSSDLLDRLDELSNTTGRTREALVADAVARYLAGEQTDRAEAQSG